MTPDYSLSLDHNEESKEFYEVKMLSKHDKAIQLLAFKNFIDDTINEPFYEYEINTQTASSWINSLSGKNTWSSRESNWVDSSTKLVFGVSSKRELNRWLIILNWMGKHIKSSKECNNSVALQQSS